MSILEVEDNIHKEDKGIMLIWVVDVISAKKLLSVIPNYQKVCIYFVLQHC